jgi:hypothetical protein
MCFSAKCSQSTPGTRVVHFSKFLTLVTPVEACQRGRKKHDNIVENTLVCLMCFNAKICQSTPGTRVVHYSETFDNFHTYLLLLSF